MVNTLYIATAGTVSIDFRDQGNIVCVVLVSSNVAAGDAELSFNSTSALVSNDTTGVIAGIMLDGSGGAGGGGPVILVAPTKEAVDVGERIFLHVTGTNNRVRAFVYTDAAASRPSTRRR